MHAHAAASRDACGTTIYHFVRHTHSSFSPASRIFLFHPLFFFLTSFSSTLRCVNYTHVKEQISDVGNSIPLLAINAMETVTRRTEKYKNIFHAPRGNRRCSFCLSVCLSLCLSVSLSVCLSLSRLHLAKLLQWFQTRDSLAKWSFHRFEITDFNDRLDFTAGIPFPGLRGNFARLKCLRCECSVVITRTDFAGGQMKTLAREGCVERIVKRRYKFLSDFYRRRVNFATLCQEILNTRRRRGYKEYLYTLEGNFFLLWTDGRDTETKPVRKFSRIYGDKLCTR